MRLILQPFVALLAISPAASSMQVMDTVGSQCVAMYSGALTRVSTRSQLDVAIHTLRTNACSSKNRNITAGFDSSTKAVIEAVPVVSSYMGRFGYSSNKQFCDAYDRGDITVGTLDTYETVPVVEAMEQANRCMEIESSSRLVLTHEVIDPGNVVFNGRFTEPEASVRFSTTSTGGFKCVSPRPNSSVVDQAGITEVKRRNANFSVSCSRHGTVINGDTTYDDGAISLATSRSGQYTVWVRSDALLGVRSRREAADSLSSSRTAADAIRTERDRVAADLAKLQGRQYTPVSWYFGEKNVGSPFGGPVDTLGPRFSCGDWGGSAEHQKNLARQTLCPGGQLVNISHYKAHGGNKCGYNYFKAVCEVTP